MPPGEALLVRGLLFPQSGNRVDEGLMRRLMTDANREGRGKKHAAR